MTMHENINHFFIKLLSFLLSDYKNIRHFQVAFVFAMLTFNFYELNMLNLIMLT